MHTHSKALGLKIGFPAVPMIGIASLHVGRQRQSVLASAG